MEPAAPRHTRVALTKIGSGTFTLSGTNSYSGGTTVSNGTLLVNNTAGSGTGTGAVTVVSGATLGGSGVIGGPVTVNGTLAPGNSGVGTLTISNSLVVNSGAVLQYALGTNSDLTVVSGNLTLDGTLNVTDAGGFTNGTYTLFSYGGDADHQRQCPILTIGTTPITNLIYTVDISSNGYVNLIVVLATPPVAGFSGSPTSGAAPLAVTFTDASSGWITNRFWNFGDGTTTNTIGHQPEHTYTAAGSNTVSLTVSGPLARHRYPQPVRLHHGHQRPAAGDHRGADGDERAAASRQRGCGRGRRHECVQRRGHEFRWQPAELPVVVWRWRDQRVVVVEHGGACLHTPIAGRMLPA